MLISLFFEVNCDYVFQYSEYINVEVLSLVKNFFKNSNIINVDIFFLSNVGEKIVQVRQLIFLKICYFEEYIKLVKKILLDEEVVEVIGKVV